jgi:RNase H-like domain found in reverse transcriptase/Reverse transcriptase (RNA-dependent DNA polymerase)/Integrase zinc binding domain/Integrase core domain
VQKKCLELWEAKLIEESTGPWAAATVAPRKKDVLGQWTEHRMCGDYRPINTKTPFDRYPMPLPEDLFAAVGQATIFSTLDLRSGYHQLPLDSKDRCKTAFWGVNASGQDCLYQWKVLPFGLKNAPAEFQRVMDRTLMGLPYAKCYIDDILVFSNSVSEHEEHLRQVFWRLREAGLKLHPKKCKFFCTEVEYLGHMIRPGTLGVQLAKVDALKKIPVPRDVTGLKSFLGLAGYYRRFIPHFSLIASPLTALFKKGVPYEWTEKQQIAFDLLKERLAADPILRQPRMDRPFVLHTDWSSIGMGAVLAQEDENGQEYVVAYASRSNNDAESRYGSYEGECLAAVWGITHFRPYVYGRRFKLITDNQPLKWIMETERLQGKLARWALILQEYSFEVIHRKGKRHGNADGLSRGPDPSRVDVTGARYHNQVDTMEEGTEKEWEGDGVAAGLVAWDVFYGEVIETEDQREQQEVYPDIWNDVMVIKVLQGGTMEGLTHHQKDRIQHRMRNFQWKDGHLWRKGEEGQLRVVPRPEHREDLIRQIHEELGHFGVERTLHLVRQNHWWQGMRKQVQGVVRACSVCDRVRAGFETRAPVLQPLPIMGLGYRWSIDYAGPLPITKRSNKYVCVMVEHFSKWVELVPLPDKTSAYSAAAFLDRVITHFGAPAEVVSDRGGEFEGHFQKMLMLCLIDNCKISRPP